MNYKYISSNRASKVIRAVAKNNEGIATKAGKLNKILNGENKHYFSNLYQKLTSTRQAFDVDLSSQEQENIKIISCCILLNNISKPNINNRFYFNNRFNLIEYKIDNETVLKIENLPNIIIYLCENLNSNNIESLTVVDVYEKIAAKVKDIDVILKEMNNLMLPKEMCVNTTEEQRQLIIKNDSLKWKDILSKFVNESLQIKDVAYSDMICKFSDFLKFFSENSKVKIYDLLFDLEDFTNIQNALKQHNIIKQPSHCYRVNGRIIYTTLSIVKNIIFLNEKKKKIESNFKCLINYVEHTEGIPRIPYEKINNDFLSTGKIPTFDEDNKPILSAFELYGEKGLDERHIEKKFCHKMISTHLKKNFMKKYVEMVFQKKKKCIFIP